MGPSFPLELLRVGVLLIATNVSRLIQPPNEFTESLEVFPL